MLGRSYTARPPGAAGLARRAGARGAQRAAGRDAGAPPASALRASLSGVTTEASAGDAADTNASASASAAAGAAGASASSDAPASFADVPEPAWAAFMAAFLRTLDGALREHAARCAGVRATQLVTTAGTRMEAFATSCPTPSAGWMDRRR